MIFFLKPCFVTDAPSVCASLVKSRWNECHLALYAPLGFYYICNLRSNPSLSLPADPHHSKRNFSLYMMVYLQKEKEKIWYLQ